MSSGLKHVIEEIGTLSADERAFVAHCLISSLEGTPEDGVDEAWAGLAEKRFRELESGAVKGVSWQKIKNKVKGADG